MCLTVRPEAGARGLLNAVTAPEEGRGAGVTSPTAMESLSGPSKMPRRVARRMADTGGEDAATMSIATRQAAFMNLIVSTRRQCFFPVLLD